MAEDGSITLRFPSLRSFLAEYGSRISPEGVLLSEQLPAVGSVVDLEVRLADGLSLLRARGETLWRRPVASLAGAEAAAVRFEELDEPSRTLLERIADQRRREGLEPFRLRHRPPPGDPTVPAAEAFPGAEQPVRLRSLATPSVGAEVFELAAGVPPVTAPLAGVESEAAPSEPAGGPSPEPDWDLEPVAEAPVQDVEPEAAGQEPEAVDLVTEAFPPSFVDEVEAELATAVPPEPDSRDSDREPADRANGALATEAEVTPAAVTGTTEATSIGAPSAGLETASTEVATPEGRPPAPARDRKPAEPSGPPVEMPVEKPAVEAAVEAEPPAPKKSRRLATLVLIGLLAVALIVAAYFLVQLVLGGRLPGRTTPGAGGAVPEPTELAPAPVPTPPAAQQQETPPAPDTGQDPEPRAAGAAAGPAETRAAEEAPPPPAEPSRGPLTGLDRIRWTEEESATILDLAGDGEIRPRSVRTFRLAGDVPREVIRISGVSRSFEPAVLEVGTAHVLRLRTGLHATDEGQELHVVIDLADGGVRLLDITHLGRRLEVRLGPGPG